MWLYTPGEGIPLLDLDPADNVGLHNSGQLFTARCILEGGLRGHTLLWTSTLSMPAIAFEMCPAKAWDVDYVAEGRKTGCVF